MNPYRSPDENQVQDQGTQFPVRKAKLVLRFIALSPLLALVFLSLLVFATQLVVVAFQIVGNLVD